MAAAIGNGRVMRAFQSGTTVTVTHGDLFTAADERKPIYWADGQRSIIVSYIDANNVTVTDDASRNSQGLTIDPTYRHYNDTVADEQLRTRQSSLLCRVRFYEAMSPANEGLIVPGFALACARGQSKIEYCSIVDGYKYTIGFHNKGYQIITKIDDDIRKLLLFPNKFVAICSSRTWHAPTNTSEFITVENTGVVVSVIGGVDILDNSVGCYDWGSIKETENGKYMVFTNESGGVGLREFDGFAYGANLLEVPGLQQTSYGKEFRKLQQATCAIYDGHAGYLIWGRKRL
jgi:hypothetical protein